MCAICADLRQHGNRISGVAAKTGVAETKMHRNPDDGGRRRRGKVPGEWTAHNAVVGHSWATLGALLVIFGIILELSRIFWRLS